MDHSGPRALTADTRLAERCLFPMKICHLGKYYPPATGGMEAHVRLLARGQAELGAQVRVIGVNHIDAFGRDVTWDVFRQTPFLDEHDGPVRVTRMSRRASLARFDVCPGLASVLRQLSGDKFDVLHLHTPNPAMVLALNFCTGSLPLVISHHSDVVRQKYLGLAFRLFEQPVYRRAALILADSPEYAAGSFMLRCHRNRVTPLPLGIDLEPFLNPSAESMEIAAAWKQQFGEPLWLCVGRLVYYKGFETAVRALARAPGRLVVIGTGPREPILRRLADKVGVAGRIVWRGSVDDATLAAAYHAATALWFPSNARSEAFGLVQVEAMAAGCPVINTQIPQSGVPWVCRDGREGLTVPVNDSEELAAAAMRLLAEPGLRGRLADAGRRRAMEEYDYRRMAARSLELYGEAIGIKETARP